MENIKKKNKKKKQVELLKKILYEFCRLQPY